MSGADKGNSGVGISDERLKRRVLEFWQGKPCGSVHAIADEGTREYFAQVERRRYELEPYIPAFADFDSAKGARLLEVGVGLGTDFVRFVRAGAIASGIDLTPRAVALVKRRLELEALSAEVRVADAERLPFESGTFDIVYSWGVIHATPDTPKALAEIARVAKPGAPVRVMVYARACWVSLALWIRHALVIGRPWRSVDQVVAGHLESPGMKVYSVDELHEMFKGFQDVRIDRALAPADRRVGGPLATMTRRRLGQYLMVAARAPV